MIDLEPGCLAVVRDILTRYVAEYEVIVFGSRANGNVRKFSDLDLALIGNHALPLRRLAELRDALSESRLPIMVDVLDWYALTAEFRRLVLGRFETIQVAPGLNPDLRSTLQSARPRD